MKSRLPVNLNNLLHLRTIESDRVEFKSGWEDNVKDAVVRTVCAFANDLLNNNGGYIILGVKEKDGKPVFPPCGMGEINLDLVQKQIRGACKGGISPEYIPLFFVETFENKTILILFAPAGQNRPYEAPGRGGKDKIYWVRIGPETIEARGDIRRQLMEQAGKVPFDDRRSLCGKPEDVSLVLLKRYLKETKIYPDPMGLDTEEICEMLGLTVPVNAHKVPRNVALLFFNEDPGPFFPSVRVRIDVAQFSDGAGDVIDERTFEGPLNVQIRSCVKYLKGIGGTIIQKIPDRAEAEHTVPYPLGAIEEAVVNAVYHRSYEYTSGPIKVCMFPDQMEIWSYPGPVRGIEHKHFETGRIPRVPLRNRRIGEFLKSLKLAETWRTGVKKIKNEMEENGSPKPVFDFDEDRTYFSVTLPVHPLYLKIAASRKVNGGNIVVDDALMENTKSLASEHLTDLQIPDAYRKWIIGQCQHMDLKKLMERGTVIQVRLPEIFIPLYADSLVEKSKNVHEIKDGGPVDIEDLVAANDTLLVEGQAGSGKTTLLKHIAYTVINKSFGRGCNDFLPVLVFLKDLQKLIEGPEGKVGNASTAEEFLADYFTPIGLGLDIVRSYCEAGKVMFLIDGLDEIDTLSKDLVVNSLAGFRNKFGQCKMVLSGRPSGVNNTVVNLFGENRIRINTLNMGQVEGFIKKWFDFVFIGGTHTGGKTATEMIGEIRSHRSINELIDNPLMLTAICILYYDDRELPGQRVELYKKFVDNLIHRRFDGPEEVLDFLMTLAFKVHESKKRGFDRTLALELMDPVYTRKPDETVDEHRKRNRRKFDEIEQNCGLLKLENGQYEFWHLAFQEFLGARYIASKKYDYINEIAPYWEDDWYREFVELFIGFLSIDSKGWANKIVLETLEKEDKSPFKRWRLAAGSLLDMHKSTREDGAIEKARERLMSIFENEEGPKVKADAGEILGRLGDTRNLEEFVPIPGGKYNLENIGTVDIETFEIGRYPVTNSWYEKFVKADGYKNEEFWSPNGWEWIKENNYEYPRLWHERQWKCPNSPVVGVSWYEAEAFCRWLTVSMKDGYSYRLPTEQEWQAAAAGKERRKYPWGECDEGRCNNEGAGIEKTSPVGIFPKGSTPDYGLVDMSGNVWEWTCTDYDSRKEISDLVSGKYRPVLKGGTWWDEKKDNTSCVALHWINPNLHGDYCGFRCARTKIAL